jgi:hypothetical protein
MAIRYKLQTAERAHTWSDEGKQCCIRNSRFDQNRSASVAVRNQAPDIHARGNESPNQERRKRNGRSSRSRWRESEPKVLEDHFFTRSPHVRTSTVHALKATSLSHLLQLSLTKHGRGTKNQTRHTKKTLLEPNRKSRTKISPSTETQASSLYKTSSSLLFGIISLSLSLSLSLSAAEVHSLLVRKSLPKRKKKQNQQQQQQIAANNLLFFLLLFTKRFPEIDQKNQNKIQNRYQTKMKGT